MIELNEISVTFNKKTPLEKIALNKINLKIEAGDFITVIGGNGAGKSTLMNLLSGEVFADKGFIKINNNDITKVPTEKRANYISRVFQDPSSGTCCDLSIEENLSIAYSRGQKRKLKIAINSDNKTVFKNALKDLGVGLEARLEDPIKMLSGGQRQAVSLLMATLRGSKILLLDEHTAALDPKMAKKIMELTEKLVKQHKLTTLMITHSMHQALEHGTKTVVMQEGEIVKIFEGQERKNLKPEDLINFFES